MDAITVIYFIVVICSVICIWYCISNDISNASEYNVYVINLDDNTERFEKFMKEYTQLQIANSWNIKRFSAVDGRKLTYDDIKPLVTNETLDGIKFIDSTQTRTTHSQLTRGMLGCYLSHIELYRRHLNSGRPLLVFEDDAGFNEDISTVVKNFKEFPNDWDIILLGTVRIIDSTDAFDNWYKVYEFWGLQGYIISNKGMKKVIQNAFPIQEQIDGHLGKLAKMGILNIYAHKQNMVKQTSIYSDVQMNLS